MHDAIHMGFRAYSNALRDGKSGDECVEAAMRAALEYRNKQSIATGQWVHDNKGVYFKENPTKT